MRRVGIVGSGQLGWMLIQEGIKLNIHFSVIDSNPDAPASRIADEFFLPSKYKEFVDSVEVVTPEFEHVDPGVLKYAEEQGKLYPGLRALDLKLERHREKLFLKQIAIRTPKFYVANGPDEAISFSENFDESVIKRSSGGYDGKGQYLTSNTQKPKLPDDDATYVVEEYIRYDFEASIIAVRMRNGRILFNEPSYNFNSSGILVYNYAPCPDFGMREKARAIMEALDYVGVMGIEFFIVSGESIVNEFAPRVHNSGHHTLSGSSISQFEQHLRAVLDIPLPEPQLLVPSGMVNIIGREIDNNLIDSLLSIGQTKVYSYGKEPRPKRKLGHVNVVAESTDDLLENISRIKDVIYHGELP